MNTPIKKLKTGDIFYTNNPNHLYFIDEEYDDTAQTVGYSHLCTDGNIGRGFQDYKPTYKVTATGQTIWDKHPRKFKDWYTWRENYKVWARDHIVRRNIHQLTEAEINELKQHMLGKDATKEMITNLPKIEVYERYQNFSFTKTDFQCNKSL